MFLADQLTRRQIPSIACYSGNPTHVRRFLASGSEIFLICGTEVECGFPDPPPYMEPDLVSFKAREVFYADQSVGLSTNGRRRVRSSQLAARGMEQRDRFSIIDERKRRRKGSANETWPPWSCKTRPWTGQLEFSQAKRIYCLPVLREPSCHNVLTSFSRVQRVEHVAATMVD